MTEHAVKKVMAEKLDFSNEEVESMAIERAHRVKAAPTHKGATPREGPRQIVVKFNSFKSRDTVLKACRTLKPERLYG